MIKFIGGITKQKLNPTWGRCFGNRQSGGGGSLILDHYWFLIVNHLSVDYHLIFCLTRCGAIWQHRRGNPERLCPNVTSMSLGSKFAEIPPRWPAINTQHRAASLWRMALAKVKDGFLRRMAKEQGAIIWLRCEAFVLPSCQHVEPACRTVRK